jgi:hypothetical protein
MNAVEQERFLNLRLSAFIGGPFFREFRNARKGSRGGD